MFTVELQAGFPRLLDTHPEYTREMVRWRKYAIAVRDVPEEANGITACWFDFGESKPI